MENRRKSLVVATLEKAEPYVLAGLVIHNPMLYAVYSASLAGVQTLFTEGSKDERTW